MKTEAVPLETESLHDDGVRRDSEKGVSSTSHPPSKPIQYVGLCYVSPH